MPTLTREGLRLLAWGLFVLAGGSLLGMVIDHANAPPDLADQIYVWGMCSLCWYGWWRLLRFTDERVHNGSAEATYDETQGGDPFLPV
jgi:hypothetical protein